MGSLYEIILLITPVQWLTALAFNIVQLVMGNYPQKDYLVFLVSDVLLPLFLSMERAELLKITDAAARPIPCLLSESR